MEPAINQEGRDEGSLDDNAGSCSGAVCGRDSTGVCTEALCCRLAE